MGEQFGNSKESKRTPVPLSGLAAGGCGGKGQPVLPTAAGSRPLRERGLC